jgi:cytochrome c oxidase cbb3-type subunit 2
MTRAMGIAAGASLILLFATIMIVVMPSLQTQSRLQPEPALEPYSEQAQRGRDIYVSLGCVYCHSQQPRDPGQAPDKARGWGRPSVPGDYAYDNPHLLGTMRTGPDLLNIGARQPSVDWHLTHLYNPRAVVPGSTMPAYPFLFEETAEVLDDQVAVNVPAEYRDSPHVVATQQALDLVQYLLELDRTYPTERIPEAAANDGADDPS